MLIIAVSIHNSVFTFHLSGSGGALLMLPQGGTRHTLVATTEFRTRVGQYWQDWYEFAKGKVDLEEGQALYLVTGFERCSTWAMAVWDSTSTYKHDELDSLELTVVKSTGACSWAYPPARCSTQSLSSLTINSDSAPFQNQETVFIRGFRIDRFDGSTSSQSPTLLSVPRQEKNRNSDNDSNSRGSGSRDRPAGGGSSPNSSTSTHPSIRGGGPSGPQSDPLAPLVDKSRILELELNGQDLFDDSDDSITHPCRIINQFAFLLISKTEPALLDAGCAALSHDEDWIDIVRDSDEEFPSNVEIVKRICSEFKFLIDGNIIYTASMTDADRNLLEKSETTRLQKQGSALSVIVLVVCAAIGDHVTTISPTADEALGSQRGTDKGDRDRKSSSHMVSAAPGLPHAVFVGTGDRFAQSIIMVKEILDVIIVAVRQAARSGDEIRRLRAETIKRGCKEFRKFLQDQDFRHFEDPWEDFRVQTLDNHEAYLQDLKGSDVSDDGTRSAQFDVWLKISREHANLIQWLPRLKQDLEYKKQSRSRHRPPSSNRGNVWSEAERPRYGFHPAMDPYYLQVRKRQPDIHYLSHAIPVISVNIPHSRSQRPTHPQARSMAPARTSSAVDELTQGLDNIHVINEDPFDPFYDAGPAFPPSASDRHSPYDYVHRSTPNFSAGASAEAYLPEYPLQRLRVLRPPGASSSSAVRLADLEHEPHSRYPSATYSGAIRAPAGTMSTVHHLTQKPIDSMLKPSKRDYESRNKDEHEKQTRGKQRSSSLEGG
ncbi:hypothetical protein PQX77_006473, partial [Marasmius sp. AFHP31]